MKALTLLLVLFFQYSFSQVTFVVDGIPENTSKESSIFISGDFEEWTGGQEKYKLQQNGEVYFITIPKQKSTINYKFTNGSWESVETNSEGLNIENRSYEFVKANDTVKMKIASWTNSAAIIRNSTATKNVFILSEDFEIPQLNRKRRVWMYLPPNYEMSNESYPVMYMHDGQNIFDAATSFSGEWEVDETLNKLYKENDLKLIVVGVDNGGVKRLDEYSPWMNEEYGGGEGDAYVDFLVNTLKPYIDDNFRTLPDKENTAIMGSSMGGLISYYAALKHPDVYGKAGVFSPSLWFSKESIDYAKTRGYLKDTNMYFLAGEREGDNVSFEEISQTVKDMNTAVELLKDEGFPSKNIISKTVPDGEHNEKFWRTEFEEAILWLFEK